MASRTAARRADWPLGLAAGATVLFLHVPLMLIVVYAFSAEDKSFVFPPPGLTTRWFGAAWQRADLWQALTLSLQVAAMATALALFLGTLAAIAVWRSRFFGP